MFGISAQGCALQIRIKKQQTIVVVVDGATEVAALRNPRVGVSFAFDRFFDFSDLPSSERKIE